MPSLRNQRRWALASPMSDFTTAQNAGEWSACDQVRDFVGGDVV